MGRRVRRVLLWSATALLAVLVASIAALFMVDLSSYRAAVEARASTALGRPVTIDGDLEIKASLIPTLAATQVAVANIPGGSRDEMARIGRLEIGLELLPLFGGAVRITHVAVVEADIILEIGADGRGNWQFDPGGNDADGFEASSDPGESIGVAYIGRLELRDATISHAGLDGRTRRLDIKSAILAMASEDDPMRIEIECIVDGLPVEVSGTTGSFGAFLAGTENWPIDASAEIADSRISVKGTLDDPMTLAALSVDVEAEIVSADGIERILGLEPSGLPPFRALGSVSGNPDEELHLTLAVDAGENSVSVEGSITDPADLAEFTMHFEAEIESLLPFAGILDARPPSVPAFEARGTVAGTPDEVRLIGVSMTFGESDLSGDLTIALSATPPTVTGEIRSERLVVADLPTAAEPGGGDGGSPTAAPSADAIDPLDWPLPVDILAAANIDLGLTVGEIVISDSTTEEVKASLRLHDSRLTVSIPVARLSQGSLTASASLNARQQPPSVTLDVATERFNLGGLLRDLQVTEALTIRMDARVRLDGVGDTPRALLAGLNGDVVVEADEGRVNARFAGLFGRSLLTAVLPIGDSDTVNIHCAVGHFVVADGIARSTAMGVDTERATIRGEGGVDLRTRTIDFLYTQQTKDASLMPLVAPVRVHGPIVDPQVTVMTTEVMRGVVRNSLLVALVPYSVILPFIPGTSDDPENCQAALYETLTAPSPSVPERIVGGAAGVVGGVAEGAVGVVEGVVGGVGRAASGTGEVLGTIGRGIGGALGGLFGGGDAEEEQAVPAE